MYIANGNCAYYGLNEEDLLKYFLIKKHWASNLSEKTYFTLE